MDFWDDDFFYEPERLRAEEDALLSAIFREDAAQAVKILVGLPPLDRGAPICLRRALERSPELFRQVLEHCAPNEYSEICI